MSIINASVPIIDFTTVGNVGDSDQIMAGHVLTVDDETLIGSMIAMYNLSDNTDLTGNANTLNDADAYNGTTGILNVANSGHLGVAGQHLQADNVTGFSGTGDLNVSIGGWFKVLASSGLLAVGTNSATQKVQFYSDSNGFIICDIAGITSQSVKRNVGNWQHIVLVYDSIESIGILYIDGIVDHIFAATTNLSLQANPSIWINSKTDGTLEVASSFDECFVYEGIMEQENIDILCASKIPEPSLLLGKEYEIVEKTDFFGLCNNITTTENQLVTSYNGFIYNQAFQYDEDDKIKLVGKK